MLTINSIRNIFKDSDYYFSGTSMWTKWLYLRRKVLRGFNPSIPKQLWIGVTYRCQCQCIHCFLGPQLNKNREELTREEIYHLIETARDLGFLEVSYFGGEPLLRDDLTDLIRFASSKGLLTTIFTNGILITPEKARALKEAGLFFCNVSIDTTSPEEHDALRGYKGCFEKTVEGIKNLVDAGIRCSIWTYVRKVDVQERALRDLDAIIEMGRFLKVWKVVILFPMASGNWLCGAENILTQAEREKVRSHIETFHPPPFIGLEFHSEDTPCSAGKRMVYISPQGDVSPCPSIPYFFGNVHKESFKLILKKLHKKFTESTHKECGECVMNADSFRDKIGISTEIIDDKIDSL